jgi:hypothetical protein
MQCSHSYTRTHIAKLTYLCQETGSNPGMISFTTSIRSSAACDGLGAYQQAHSVSCGRSQNTALLGFVHHVRSCIHETGAEQLGSFSPTCLWVASATIPLGHLLLSQQDLLAREARQGSFSSISNVRWCFHATTPELQVHIAVRILNGGQNVAPVFLACCRATRTSQQQVDKRLLLKTNGTLPHS